MPKPYPFAALPRSGPHLQQTYIFTEPQYMDPQFGGVSNIYRPRAIVQLPKIYGSTVSLRRAGETPQFCPLRVKRGEGLSLNFEPLCRLLPYRHHERRSARPARSGCTSIPYDVEECRRPGCAIECLLCRRSSEGWIRPTQLYVTYFCHTTNGHCIDASIKDLIGWLTSL